MGGYGGYPIAPGGAGTPGTDGKDAFAATYAAFTWGNANEDLFFQVPAGSVDWMAPLQWISVSDGVHAGYLTVVAVGPVDPEAPGIQQVQALDQSTPGNPTVGTVIASGAMVAVAGKPGAAGAAGSANVSGTTNTLVKFTSATVGGDSSITDDATTVASGVPITARGSISANNDSIGTTKTFGVRSVNATSSGSQVSAQIGGSANHSGGTVLNYGFQNEPQSTTRQIIRLCYGTGASPPASTGLLVDTSDSTFGLSTQAACFVSTLGTGFRTVLNGGGVKENGSGRLLVQSAVAGEPLEFLASTSTGNTGARFQFTADAGTPSAGYLARWGHGAGSFVTQVFGVFWNGRLELPNVDPAAAGQLGMNTTTGRPRVYVNSTADSVAVLADIGGAALQSGVATLSSGVTGNITAVITANTRIIVSLKTPSGTTLTTEYAALDTDRTVGATGPFKITALVAAGTINTADNSTVDWLAIG